MESSPRLIQVARPRSPVGAVLVLHGGASRGDRMMVSPTQLSVVRMIPTAKAAARAGNGRLAVYRLLNSWRGWDGQHTPVADARWAMAQVRGELGDLPLGLIGHSLGGRAALLAGAEPDVVSVVALNPWVYPTDDADLTGRRVLVLHGTQDRVASMARARTVAANLARTADVEFVEIEGGKHAMLRHGREFDRRAADFTAQTLLSRV
ncbi:alpha/beta hydrolase [Nocardioides sp.]|uniref:alpha/beta hydrolase n=1 Tax=Nocardioides sp. TaxID=35761 RepID=UPI0025DE3178|nr:alpha/beta hydrolase [Nocardioides sp.]